MKKLACVLLIVSTIFLLLACSKGEKAKLPELDDDVKLIAEKVIDIIDRYLDMSISYDDAAKELLELEKRMEMKNVSEENYDSESIEQAEVRQIESLLLKWKVATFSDDIEIQELRDIIAYPAGIAVTGRVYDYTTEESAQNTMQMYGIDPHQAQCFELYPGTTALGFDKMYGHEVDQIYSTVRQVLDNIPAEERADLFISYDAYRTNVFYLSITEQQNGGFYIGYSCFDGRTYNGEIKDISAIKRIVDNLATIYG